MARPRSEQPDKPPKPLPVECCPPLDRDGTCDVIDFRYRLIHRAPTGGEPAIALVEVILHYRLERCPGPLTLGELVYTTTLLPGEKVRLFTTDRKTRFTFDSETNLSHRSEQTTEEQFYMSSMADFMSDLTVVDRQSTTNTASGSTSGHFETNGAIQAFFSGPSVDVSGSFGGGRRATSRASSDSTPSPRIAVPCKAPGPQTPCRSERCRPGLMPRAPRKTTSNRRP